MADKGVIIIPKPGEVLSLLGASGALADAAKEAIRDYTRLKEGLWKVPSQAQLGIDWAELDGPNIPGRSYTKFKAEYFGGFPADQNREALYSTGFSIKTLRDEDPVASIDWGDDDGIGPTIINKDAMAKVDWSAATDKFKGSPAPYAAQAAIDAHAILGSFEDEVEESVMDIGFWYYGNTTLVYSIRRVVDNFFYDFATKTFKMMPVSPRAGMPRAAPINSAGYVYSTRLSGKLDDGEYVVTFRDSKTDYVVIGIMALFMKDGAQQSAPSQGLEDTPIEEGIPSPQSIYRRAERRVRPVDTGGTEGSEEPVTSGQG